MVLKLRDAMIVLLTYLLGVTPVPKGFLSHPKVRIAFVCFYFFTFLSNSLLEAITDLPTTKSSIPGETHSFCELGFYECNPVFADKYPGFRFSSVHGFPAKTGIFQPHPQTATTCWVL